MLVKFSLKLRLTYNFNPQHGPTNYKHHNTGKVLVACTPNGAVNFIPDLYVGSISDVELTRVCGIVQKLPV